VGLEVLFKEPGELGGWDALWAFFPGESVEGSRNRDKKEAKEEEEGMREGEEEESAKADSNSGSLWVYSI